jgi:hypothetical protein
MSWEVALDPRAGPGEALMILAERQEAEEIAREMRARGQRVVVRPHREKLSTLGPGPAGAPEGSNRGGGRPSGSPPVVTPPLIPAAP